MTPTSCDRLELGCGARPTPGYLHQDVTAQEGVELDFICTPCEIALPEASLTEIIALGVMEHLRFAEVHETLAHLHGLLKEGGELLFDVPDMKVWAEYLMNVTHGASEKNPFTDEHVWSTIYGWQRWPGDEHKSGWTRESITDALTDAGFQTISEGVEHFTEKGFERRRFGRPEDAHLYMKAIR